MKHDSLPPDSGWDVPAPAPVEAERPLSLRLICEIIPVVETDPALAMVETSQAVASLVYSLNRDLATVSHNLAVMCGMIRAQVGLIQAREAAQETRRKMAN